MYRILKKPRGWIIEHQVFKYSFFGLHFWKVWRPFVKSSGLDCAWHSKTKEWAIEHLLLEIKQDHLILLNN